MANGDPSPTSTNLWALLVGIDDYLAPNVNDLRGCVNDVDAMQVFLVNQLHVPDAQIRRLRNSEATRERILAEFQSFLIENPAIATGSQILFHYSGHGSQMPSTSPNEPDGRDETIVPHDSRQGGVFDIPDKTLAALIDRLAAAKGDNITVILDSCHSGSGTRKIEEPGSDAPLVRKVEADDRPPPPDLDAALRVGAGTRSLSPSGWSSAGVNHVLLAGCRDRELSREYAASEGITHGALTYFTLEYLRNLPPGASYAELHERVAAQVNAIYRDQMPQCEGQRERLVFGTGMVDRDPFIRVQSVAGDSATLSAGLVHGLMVGTELALFPPEIRKRAEATPDKQLAAVVVTAVRATSATVQLKPPATAPSPLPSLARALITGQVYEGIRQTVGFTDEDGSAASEAALAALGGFVADSRYLKLQTAPSESPQIYVKAKDGQLRILGADGSLLVLPEDFAPSAAGAANAAVAAVAGSLADAEFIKGSVLETLNALESIARFRSLQNVANKALDSALAGKIALAIQRQTGTAAFEDVVPNAAGELKLPFDPDALDDQANVYYVTVINNSSKPVNAYVFYLNPDFGIFQLYPDVGQDEEIIPGGRKPVGFRVDLPANWNSSRDQIKFIVTTEPGDFSTLVQPGLNVPPPDKGVRALTSSLASLLSAVGSGTRFGGKPQIGDGDDWTTVDVVFNVVRTAQTRSLEAPAAAVELGNGMVLHKPAGFTGQVTVSALEHTTRDLSGTGVKPPPGLAALPGTFQLVGPTGTRDVGDPGLVITFELDEASRAGISAANPLRIEVPELEDPDVADCLPVVFDGEDYLLAGFTEPDSRTVQIQHLPPPMSPPGTKSLGHLLTLFLFKKLGRHMPDVGLRYAERDANGHAVYSEVTPDRFKKGQRVAVFVHGFSADTIWMVENMPQFLADAGASYDHILAFDYESFGTGVLENGQELADALRQKAGFGPDDGIVVDVYAHSMGCLVCRCMIEIAQGNAFVDRLVIAGPPNKGTTLASLSRGLTFMATVSLNNFAAKPMVGAFNWTAQQLFEQSTGLADIAVDSPITARLNALDEPKNVPYLALAGTNQLNPNIQDRVKRLALKVLDQTLDSIFNDQNDVVIGLTSMKSAANAVHPERQVRIMPCDHFGYYSIPESQAAIREWRAG